MVINKVDTVALEDIEPEKRAVLAKYEQQGIMLLTMSTLTGQGVVDVKTKACEKLLAHRVDEKASTGRVHNVLNRLHLAVPRPRDNKDRPAFIPEGALEKRMGRVPSKGRDDRARRRAEEQAIRERRPEISSRKLEIDKQHELGADYSQDLRGM